MKLDKTTTVNNRSTDNTNRKSLGEALCDLDDLICEVNKSKCIQEIKRISLLFDDDNDDVFESKKMFTQLNQNNRKEIEEQKIADKSQKYIKKISTQRVSRDMDINKMNSTINNNIKTHKKLGINEKGIVNTVSASKSEISPNRVVLMSVEEKEHKDTITSCERKHSVGNEREHEKNNVTNDSFNSSQNEDLDMLENGKRNDFVENNKIHDQNYSFATDNSSDYGSGDNFSVMEKNDDKTKNNSKYEIMNRKDNGNYDVLYDVEDEATDNCENQPIYRCLSRNTNKELDKSKHLTKKNSFLDDLDNLDDLLQEVNKDKNIDQAIETENFVTTQCLEKQITTRKASPESIQTTKDDLIENEFYPPQKLKTELYNASTDQTAENNCNESTYDIDDNVEANDAKKDENELINNRENTAENSTMLDENKIYDPMSNREEEIDNIKEKLHFGTKRENTLKKLNSLDDDLHKSDEINELISEREEQMNDIEGENNSSLNKRPSRKFKRNISTEELEDLFGGEPEEEKENESEIMNDKLSNDDYEPASSDDDVTKRNKRGGYIEPNINLMLLYERMVSDLNLENCELRRENLKTSSALKRRIEGLQGDIIMLRSDLMLKNDFIKHLLNTVKCE